MPVMTNYDILQLLKLRDTRFDLFVRRLIRRLDNAQDISKVRKLLEWSIDHKNSFVGIKDSFDKTVTKQEKIFDLKEKLKSNNYFITEEDVETLRDCYIFMGGPKGRVVDDECFDDTFVVIGDYYGEKLSIEAVTELCVKNYDVVYIMGNSTDLERERKTGAGIFEHLKTIKELCEKYPDKVFYIPGYLDLLFVDFGYDDTGISYETMCECLHKYSDVIEWLGKQPIQAMQMRDGVIYAMAHGSFNQSIMDEYPEYCLRDFFDSAYPVDRKKIIDILHNSNFDSYDKNDLPTDKTEIITASGHKNGNSIFKIVTEGEEQYIPVISIDKDNIYNGNDFGSFLSVNYHDDKKNIFHTSILTDVYAEGSDAFCVFDPISRFFGVSREECFDIVNSIEGQFGFSYGNMDELEKFALYRKIFVFDTILESLFSEGHSSFSTADLVQSGMFFSDATRVSSDSDIVYLIDALGENNIIEVLLAYNCDNVNDYVQLKFDEGIKRDTKVYEKEKPTE